MICTEQNPAKLGGNEANIKKLWEKTISKVHFNACADGLLDAFPYNRGQIIIVGCEAQTCLLQTALELLAHDYVVRVVVDAVPRPRKRARHRPNANATSGRATGEHENGSLRMGPKH
ncbi:MAG: isochorismatase family protein [Glaciimonas sp.]|nr:isochorismatase family protein [Glaciimonas sp.]